MKLIKIQGELSDVKTKEELGGNYHYGYRQVDCFAIIEIIVSGLPRSQRYVVYKDDKNKRYYCNVQKRKTYLDTLESEE